MEVERLSPGGSRSTMAMPQEGRFPDLDRLIARFREPGVQAIALMGSHARGDAGPFSDVDVARFLSPGCAAFERAQSFIIENRLVVVSTILPENIEGWFADPDLATECIAGLRTARPLWDPEGVFAHLQARAHAFRWDSAMQGKANAFAADQMVGWAEEAFKGLEGLRRGDPGRLLNARFGLSFGMMKVARVYLGVLIAGDNAFYSQIIERVGVESEWARLGRAAFGIEGPDGKGVTLREQVLAGLGLYVSTAHLVRDDVDVRSRAIMDHAVEVIEREMEELHQVAGPEAAGLESPADTPERESS